MKTTILSTCLGAAVLAAPARADVMHWFWEVEVNGDSADASRPVVVDAGDQVEINFWAAFEPYRSGFAGAEFSITAGDAFFASGEVTIDPHQGYGLNPDLLALGLNGSFVDADGSGTVDTVDEVLGVQLARGWNANFDPSDPILVYRVGWALDQTPSGMVELVHGPALISGEFHNGVWGDNLGFEYFEYTPVSDVLRFVPSPGAWWIPVAAWILGGRGRPGRARP